MMITMHLKMLSCYLLILSCVCLVSGHDRKITSFLNPGCNTCNSKNTTLVYVKAVGSQDSVHQIWDFTRGKPTIIYAISGLYTNLTIKWDSEHPVLFSWNETVQYSFSMVFDKLFEYNDVSDYGQFDTNSTNVWYDLRDLTWTRDSVISNDNEVQVEVHANGFKTSRGRWRDGIIRFKLDLLPYKDYGVVLPHLIHTANTTLVDVALVNLTTTPSYHSPRFACYALLASTDPHTDSMSWNVRRSLDDEHTPGIFEIIEIKTPESYQKDDGGFVQFRPVSYTKEERSVASSTLVHVSQFSDENLPHRSTVSDFYKYFDRNHLLVQGLYVSFGEPGDGFYTQNNYTAWSYTMGYGEPPVEGFSLFVILVISIGLGVPVLLALSGVIYLFAKKCRQNPRSRLENEE